jgi:hypothetical protein
MKLQVVSVHPEYGEKAIELVINSKLEIWPTIQGIFLAYNATYFDGGLRTIKNITVLDDYSVVD